MNGSGTESLNRREQRKRRLGSLRLLLFAIFVAGNCGTFANAETNKSDCWSFKPASKPIVPAIADSKWPRNELDRFILSKLREQKLSPSADADRRTLIRRVTFNLTGLPPTPEEAASFVADTN